MDIEEKKHSRNKDIEQLETLAFHFTQLSKRLSQDREHWAETGKEFTKAVEKLDQTIQAFADFEESLKDRVTAVLRQKSQDAAQTIAEACRDTMQRVLAEQIKAAADHLNRVVHEASNTLSDYQGELKTLRRWFLITIILSSVLGIVLAGAMIYYFLFS